MNSIPSAPLGGSSLRVSRIALGSWRTVERMPRQDAEQLLAHALGAGVTFLDDARYNDETGKAPLRTGWSEALWRGRRQSAPPPPTDHARRRREAP